MKLSPYSYLNRILRRYIHESKGLIKYFFLGGIGASTDFAIFIILVNKSTNIFVSNIVSTCCGILVSFVLNSTFTFKTRMNLDTFLRFFSIGIAGLVFSSLYLKWLVNGIGISPNAAKASALPLIATLQYLCNRFWTFRDI